MSKVSVQVMMDSKDRALLAELARQQGRPISNYVRGVLEAHLEKERSVVRTR